MTDSLMSQIGGSFRVSDTRPTLIIRILMFWTDFVGQNVGTEDVDENAEGRRKSGAEDMEEEAEETKAKPPCEDDYETIKMISNGAYG